MPRIILAYDTLKDPRDLAEVLHLAAGFSADVHLIGKSLDPRHWKVLRKLRSWRPELAGRPEEIRAERFAEVSAWAAAVRERGCEIAGTVVEGGTRPWAGSGDGSIAVLFGEETRGLTEEARILCDHRWTIPLGPGGRFYTVGQATAVVLGGAAAR